MTPEESAFLDDLVDENLKLEEAVQILMADNLNLRAQVEALRGLPAETRH